MSEIKEVAANSKAPPPNNNTLVDEYGGLVNTTPKKDSRLTALEEKKRRLEVLRARRLKRSSANANNDSLSVDGSLGTLSMGEESTANTSVNSTTQQNFDRELAQYHKEKKETPSKATTPAKPETSQTTNNNQHMNGSNNNISALANHLSQNQTPPSSGGGGGNSMTPQEKQQFHQQYHAQLSSSSSVASALPTPPPPIFEAEECPFHLKNTRTKDNNVVILSESADRDIPRHTVGCTPHECHSSIITKDGCSPLSNAHKLRPSQILQEAQQFLQLFRDEHPHVYSTPKMLKKRLQQVETDILAHGGYRHTPQELEFGCRVAWRNTGRCIMRKHSVTKMSYGEEKDDDDDVLQVRDHREVRNADDCFDKLVQQLKDCANISNYGSDVPPKHKKIRPMISVFSPKPNFEGMSSRVRIWNHSLIGYAGYTIKGQNEDGGTFQVMGDAQNVEFTALCVKYGWTPPQEKSDFDVLPLLISDDTTGHDKPKMFILPVLDAMKLQIPLEHPTNDLFSLLGLSWHSINATSHMGIDIGGIYYQTTPFSAYYTVTQIGRALLDPHRYNHMAERIAAVCDISTTTKDQLWKDQVQFELHKAIYHSFTKHGVTIVDHHTASDEFLKFYKNEIEQRKKCPADWKWLVPPAGGSMSSVYHQEMLNFILKPQYRRQVNMWEDLGIPVPALVPAEKEEKEAPVQAFTSSTSDATTTTTEITTAKNGDDQDKAAVVNGDDDIIVPLKFDRKGCVYKRICLYYGSDTGTSLSYATQLANELGDDVCVGPIPLDHLPRLLQKDGAAGFAEPTLVLVFTATLGEGRPPSMATKFLPEMVDVPPGSIGNCDFGVFALCNSAYIHNFATFGYAVHDALREVGCHPIANVQVADELKNQDDAFMSFRSLLFHRDLGLLYGDSLVVGAEDAWEENQDARYKNFSKFLNQTVDIKFQGVTHVIDALESTLEQTVDMKFQGAQQIPSDEDILPQGFMNGQNMYKPWSNPSRKVERSMDLFTFRYDEETSEHLHDISPGDRMALYPSNAKETVDIVMCMLDIDEMTDVAELRKHLTMGFDLVRPIGMDGLQSLRETVTNAQAQSVLDSILQNASMDATPSLELLVTILPPLSIPSDWVGTGAPRSDPRWFSITSMSEDKRTVTICQETVHFPHPNNHAGLTSRWLRSLPVDFEASTIFVKSDFHLPKDENAPVIMIGTGAAIASFFMFWSARTYNPLYLFYGCENEEELMFGTEINRMQEDNRMQSFLSFAKGRNRISMQEQISRQAETLLPLLHDSNTHVYVCGPPEMENAVKNALCQLMAFGDSNISGLGMQRAMEWLVLKKNKKTYIPEVYGSAPLQEHDPMAVLWQEATAKLSRVLTTLDNIGCPRPGKVQQFQTPIEKPLTSGHDGVMVRNARIAVNPIIGTGGALEVRKASSRQSLVQTVSAEFDSFPADQAARERQAKEEVSSTAVEAPTETNVVTDLIDMCFEEEDTSSAHDESSNEEDKNSETVREQEEEEAGLDKEEGASEAAASEAGVVVRAPSNPQPSGGFVHGAGSGFTRVWS